MSAAPMARRERAPLRARPALRPPTRRSPVVAALVICLWALAVAGWAHPDFFVADEEVVLAPGQRLEHRLAVHFHRLVGSLEVIGGPEHRVDLTVVADAPAQDAAGGDPVVDAAARDSAQDAAGGDPAFDAVVARGGSAIRLNHLVSCCLHATYTPHRLVLSNEGAEAARVRLRARLVHDDVAVVAHRAEVGAAGIPLALFAAMGIATLAVGLRARRLRGTLATSTERLPATFWLATASFVAACAIAAALGLAGVIGYGAGLADGMVAATADLPVPGGPFGSRAATVMGVLMLLWLTAIGCWVRSLHARPHARPRTQAGLGIALGVVSVVGGLAGTLGYPGSLVLLGLALVLAAPIFVVVLAHARRPAPGATPLLSSRS